MATASNGASNGHDEGTVDPTAFWNHARRLSPREPWRAITNELGVSNGAAREALRNTALPAGVATAALARFLTLTKKDIQAE